MVLEASLEQAVRTLFDHIQTADQDAMLRALEVSCLNLNDDFKRRLIPDDAAVDICRTPYG